MGEQATLTPPELIKRALASRTTIRVAGDGLTPAAVMVLLYPKDGDHWVLLNKRSQHVEHHKLRETEEEMGIRREDITLLGEMDEVTTRSQYRVSVFAGTIRHPYDFQPSADEIAEIVEFPVSALLDASSLRVETHWQADGANTIHSYAYGKHLVFGATARILQQFLQLLEDGLESEGLN